MYKFDFCVKVKDFAPIDSCFELENGSNHVCETLPDGIIDSVHGKLHLDLADSTRIFMNGYQTWTHCPEYDMNGFTSGVRRLPRKLIEFIGIDRYGDYHFVHYPLTKGVTHGFSYCYFRNGEQYLLFASLDERPGYTQFQFDSSSGELEIKRDCSGLRCGGSYNLFDLFIASGSEKDVFDGWFSAMDIHPRTDRKIAGYTSWYNRYRKIDEKTIEDDLDGCFDMMKDGDLFQIDDGWQLAVGDWMDSDEKKFPNGMRYEADKIHSRGYLAGLWLAPFVCSKSSHIYREHRDWIVNVEEKPWRLGINWGGFWSLDIDNPEVTDYLKKVFDKVLNEWGFDLVKLDFLYGAAPFGTEKETRAGKMIRAMEFLRECCGDKLMLACGVPLMPAFGIADYSRVSCDVSLNWDSTFFARLSNRERMSTFHAIENTIFRRQLNGRAFISDPDVFFLRSENLSLPEHRKELLATVNSLFGGVLLHSDNMAKYDERAKGQYSKLLHNREATNIQVDADDGLSISYTLDGYTKKMKVR